MEGQLTINDWLAMKESLKKDLIGVTKSFVQIGYKLRQIEEQRLYENDGHKSIADFAKAEYGLEASTVSRFIAINEKYALPENPTELRPEYENFGVSKLSEMLTLPEKDRELITPDSSREDIRELKRFNKEQPSEDAGLDKVWRAFFKENEEALNAIFTMDDEERIKDVVNPNGTRTYRKDAYMIFFYEGNIKVKAFGGSVDKISWEEFIEKVRTLFEDHGAETYAKNFGIAPAQPKEEPTAAVEETTQPEAEEEPDPVDEEEAKAEELTEPETAEEPTETEDTQQEEVTQVAAVEAPEETTQPAAVEEIEAETTVAEVFEGEVIDGEKEEEIAPAQTEESLEESSESNEENIPVEMVNIRKNIEMLHQTVVAEQRALEGCVLSVTKRLLQETWREIERLEERENGHNNQEHTCS